MGSCVSNSGAFEPPGSKAVAAFVLEQEKQTDPRWIAVARAKLEAEAERARVTNPRHNEGGMKEIPKKHKGPPCSICRGTVLVGAGSPWMRTRSDKLALSLEDSDDEDGDGDAPESSKAAAARRAKTVNRHGIELKGCQHVFCGACLSSSIYRNLCVSFDSSTYGGKVEQVQEPGKVSFPMGCPTCQLKPGDALVEVSDLTARLALGEPNMDQWNHARFISTLDIIYCPHKGCGEAFDANDVAAPAAGTETAQKGLVQCPRCFRSLCRSCKVVWHERYTCADFQRLPANERNPEDLLFLEMAQKEKWRRCPKCSAMVELNFGCNHITCTCKHHFCYQCGADFEHKNGKYQCKGGTGCKMWEEQNLLSR